MAKQRKLDFGPKIKAQERKLKILRKRRDLLVLRTDLQTLIKELKKEDGK